MLQLTHTTEEATTHYSSCKAILPKPWHPTQQVIFNRWLYSVPQPHYNKYYGWSVNLGNLNHSHHTPHTLSPTQYEAHEGSSYKPLGKSRATNRARPGQKRQEMAHFQARNENPLEDLILWLLDCFDLEEAGGQELWLVSRVIVEGFVCVLKKSRLLVVDGV